MHISSAVKPQSVSQEMDQIFFYPAYKDSTSYRTLHGNDGTGIGASAGAPRVRDRLRRYVGIIVFSCCNKEIELKSKGVYDASLWGVDRIGTV